MRHRQGALLIYVQCKWSVLNGSGVGGPVTSIGHQHKRKNSFVRRTTLHAYSSTLSFKTPMSCLTQVPHEPTAQPTFTAGTGEFVHLCDHCRKAFKWSICLSPSSLMNKDSHIFGPDTLLLTSTYNAGI